MQIKERASRPMARHIGAGLRRAIDVLRGRLLPSAAAGLALLAGSFLSGAWVGVPASLRQLAREVYHARAADLPNYVRGKLASAPHLAIDISHENHQKLRFKRQQALERGIIVTEDDSYVSADVTAGGTTARVKMRLKGDYTDHLEGDKWSFRIKVKGHEAIWGMKHFSIQDPKRSGWIKEWILHALLRHEGLIGLRYDFIEVSMNGEDLGVFALEESFAKELIEFNQRLEAPILKFDESHLIDRSSLNRGDRHSQADVYYAADILSFDTSKVLASEKLKEQFLVGRFLLAQLRDRRKPLSEVMDVERAARTFAILELLDAFHAVRWKNSRFYYNPVTMRLELIAYNAYTAGLALPEVQRLFYQAWRDGDLGSYFVYDWIDLFFSDPEFQRHYFHEIDRLTAPGHLEAFFAGIEAKLEAEKAVLYKDGPLHQATVQQYLRNRDIIREIIHPHQGLKAYLEGFDRQAGRLRVTVVNRALVPVELNAIECGQTSHQDLSLRLVQGKRAGRPLQPLDLEVRGVGPDIEACLGATTRSGDTLLLEGLQIRYGLPVGGELRAAPVEAVGWKRAAASMPVRHGDAGSVRELVERGIATVDEDLRLIQIRRGEWRLDRDVVFPAGYRVVGEAGTSLSLESGAALVSFSPVTLRGADGAPFAIRSRDGTGQGLAVLSAQGPSLLRHVVVEDQGALARPGRKLSGAVTFYESEVRIEDSRFEGGRAEDQVNLVRSDYAMRGARFVRSASDALDVDFGAGRIDASSFEACGNDCVDVSQSETSIAGVRIEGAGDKGISIGERSRVKIARTRVERANIGVACKDSSHATIDRLRIADSTTGIAAYRKKPEFSGGTVDARHVEVVGTPTPYDSDSLSSISVEGRIAPGSRSTQVSSL